MILLSHYVAIAAAGQHADADLPYADLVMETGPVGLWPLDADLVDRISGPAGTIGAGSEVYAGALPVRGGGSFECAGSSWITVAHAAALKPAEGSLMAWFKPASIHNGIIMAANAEGTSNPADFALRVNATGTVSCFFQQGGATQLIETSSPYYSAGQLIHAIVTFDASGFTLYLDGNRIASNAGHTVGFTENELAWRFGAQEVEGRERIFDGVIDEIAIWNRVLSRNEIYLLAQTEPD